MRDKFYCMEMHDSEKFECIDDYDRGTVDTRVFGKGVPFGKPFPEEIRITLGDGEPCHLFTSPFRFMLVSKALIEATKHLLGNHVEILPVTMLRHDKPIDRFVMLEPLDPIDAIKGEVTKKTLMTFLDSVTLDASKIPADRHIFRLQRYLFRVIVSQEFFDALKTAHLTGFAFFKMKVE